MGGTSRGGDMKAWIGVDLDGTLAHYVPENFPEIGEPIRLMVDRVKEWRSKGMQVRIVTARATMGAAALNRIEEWCIKHIGQVLPITDKKDFAMIELWDDRAIRVEFNTGKVL